jgi:hypothetical protein
VYVKVVHLSIKLFDGISFFCFPQTFLLQTWKKYKSNLNTGSATGQSFSPRSLLSGNGTMTIKTDNLVENAYISPTCNLQFSSDLFWSRRAPFNFYSDKEHFCTIRYRPSSFGLLPAHFDSRLEMVFFFRN